MCFLVVLVCTWQRPGKDTSLELKTKNIEWVKVKNMTNKAYAMVHIILFIWPIWYGPIWYGQYAIITVKLSDFMLGDLVELNLIFEAGIANDGAFGVFHRAKVFILAIWITCVRNDITGDYIKFYCKKSSKEICHVIYIYSIWYTVYVY